MLVEIAASVVSDEPLYPRPTLGPAFHLSIHQVINYILQAASPGHRILIRHSAEETGRLLAQQKPADNQKESTENLQQIFKNLGLGILEPNDKGYTLKESAFSSGVKDIGIKLCDYTAGLIEGYLNQTLNTQNQIEETQCTGDGGEHCEFVCGVGG